MKLCKYCRHRVLDTFYNVTWDKDRCLRKTSREFDLVTGLVITALSLSCRDERYPHWSYKGEPCGREGKFFEPRRLP